MAFGQSCQSTARRHVSTLLQRNTNRILRGIPRALYVQQEVVSYRRTLTVSLTNSQHIYHRWLIVY
jgi:hypothetical protein